MATVIIVRFTSKVLKDGSCPVMLKVQKGKTKKHYSLGYSSDENHWDQEGRCFKKNAKINPTVYSINEFGQKIETDGYKIRNVFLDRKRIRAKEIIDQFDRENIDWTLQMFEDKFLNEKKKAFILDFVDAHTNKLEEQGSTGNSDKYRQLSLILKCFQKETKTKIDKFYFHDLDYKIVSKFISYLENDRKVSGNTIHFYLRQLRAIMNQAITEGCGSKEAYCFSTKYTDSDTSVKKIIHIKDYKEETRKRYLPQEYLAKIKNTVFGKPHLEYSRRLFLLSFYMYGCSYIDLAYLQKSNIIKSVTKDGKFVENIEFKRKKTKKRYTIQIRPEIQEQMDWFKGNYVVVGDYLIPCVTKDLDGRELYNHIKNRRDRYTDYLKIIAQELEFPDAISDLTSYFSRHSYAMAMRNSGKSIDVIQEALGHTEQETTKTYLDSFDSEFLANESDGLI